MHESISISSRGLRVFLKGGLYELEKGMAAQKHFLGLASGFYASRIIETFSFASMLDKMHMLLRCSWVTDFSAVFLAPFFPSSQQLMTLI